MSHVIAKVNYVILLIVIRLHSLALVTYIEAMLFHVIIGGFQSKVAKLHGNIDCSYASLLCRHPIDIMISSVTIFSLTLI